MQWGPARIGRRYGMAVVHGRSMAPTLSDGDRLLVSYAAAPAAGVVVLARFPDGTVAVKRAVERRPTRSGGSGWWLLSDNADEGSDSRQYGAVADDDVLAVVVRRIWPPYRRSAVPDSSSA